MFCKYCIPYLHGRPPVDDSIQKHRAFVAAADAGSISRAAQQLGFSQSAVSRMIADLEADWGVTLLRRDRAGARLTPEGAELIGASRALCNQYQALRERVEEVRGLACGRLRIGTISSVATHRLPAIIAAFKQDFPGIDYELLLGDYSEIERWLLEGRVDCGFLREPCSARLRAVPFERDELMAVLPPAHPLAVRERVTLAELAAEPFLALEHAGVSEVAPLFERDGLSLRPAFTTWDDYAVMAMVERGLGVAVLPSLILTRAPYDIAVRPLAEPAHRELVFAVRADLDPPRVVKRFADYLGKSCSLSS